MAGKRLDPEVEQNIITTYKRWDFATDGTMSDMADSLGVSRQTIYRVLERNDVNQQKPRATETQWARSKSNGHGHADPLELAGRQLEQQLHDARTERLNLQERCQLLDASIAAITAALEALKRQK